MVVYKFDGTETKKQLTGSTSISGGVMRNGSAFITSHTWDNSVDWELTGEVSFTATDNAMVIVPPTNTDRTGQRMQLFSPDRRNFSIAGEGSGSGYSGISTNTWYSVVFTKVGNTLNCVLNNVNIGTVTAPTFMANSRLTVGVDQWYGSNSVSIRNIKVKPL